MEFQSLDLSNKSVVDKWVLEPIQRFISNSTMSGIVLFASAIIAVIWANSPWHHSYHELWEHTLYLGFDGAMISKSLHHWINDGLMAIFFFVVGLELKREMVAGELREPKKAMLPIVAAFGGMLVPALIYTAFNGGTPTESGWGIPMATDIAFALGVLFLLGDKVPLTLKVFLTALAIVDDLGAIIVIALFYTSEINMMSLGFGALFFGVLVIANLVGVRSTVFYAVVGIGGLWFAFLMSGVHATIAAVLVAMTIPAKVKVTEDEYICYTKNMLSELEVADSNALIPIVTDKKFVILDNIRCFSKHALTPLQRLEHVMHPIVGFVIMPIFALSNAGVTFGSNIDLINPVFLGVFLGLLIGKVLGVWGLISLLIKLKIFSMPDGMSRLHLFGGGFIAAVGFTMSLFVSSLAFTDSTFIDQAKMGILFASVTASFVGYYIIKYANSKIENKIIDDEKCPTCDCK